MTIKLTVNEWMKPMRVEFGPFEFKAVSPQGHVIQSKHWQDIDDSRAVIPAIQYVPKGKK